MASILSYNQILSILTSFTERHYMLSDFFVGKDHDFSNNTNVNYPAFQTYIESVNIPKVGDGYPVVELSLNCKILNSQKQDDSNLQYGYSDALQIVQDLTNELNQNPYYVRSQAQLTNDIKVTPIERHGSDNLVGHEFNLDGRLINDNNFCGLPLEPIPGYDFPGAVSTGYSYSIHYLTCSSLRECENYININNTSTDSINIFSGGTNLNEIFQSKGAAQETFLSTNQIAYGSSTSGITGDTQFTYANSVLTLNGGGYQMQMGLTNGFSLTVPQGFTFFSPSGYLNHSAVAHNFYRGNVGIGTPFNYSPAYNFEVDGTTKLNSLTASTLYIPTSYAEYNLRIGGNNIGIDGGGTFLNRTDTYGTITAYGWYYGGSSYPQYFNSNGAHFGASDTGYNAATAYVDISGSKTTSASLRIRTGATVSSPNDGDIWNDGTFINFQSGLQSFQGASNFNVGLDTQYGLFTAIHLTSARTNSNYFVRGNAVDTVQINSGARMDFAIGGVLQNILYNDHSRIARPIYIGDVSLSVIPSALIDIHSASTSQASLRIRSGFAPTAPNDGDIWNDGTHLYGKLNGVVRQLDNDNGSGTTFLQPNRIAFGSSTSGITDSNNFKYVADQYVILGSNGSGLALYLNGGTSIGDTFGDFSVLAKNDSVTFSNGAGNTLMAQFNLTNSYFNSNLRAKSLSSTTLSASTLVLPSLPTGRILSTDSNNEVTGSNLYFTNGTSGNYFVDIATYMQVGYLWGYQTINSAGGWPFRITQAYNTLTMGSDGFEVIDSGLGGLGRTKIQSLASASDGVVYATSAGTLSKQMLPTNQVAFGSSTSGLTGNSLFNFYPNVVGGGYGTIGYLNLGYGVAFGSMFGLDISAFGQGRISNAQSYIDFDRVTGYAGCLKFNVYSNLDQMRVTFSGVSFNTQNEATAIVDIASATTSIASLRIRAGQTVSTPNDGDIWNDGTDLYAYVGGSSQKLNGTGGSGGTVSLQPTQIAFGDSSSGVTSSPNFVYSNAGFFINIANGLAVGAMTGSNYGMQSLAGNILSLYGGGSTSLFLNNDSTITASSSEFSNTGGFRGSYLSATTLSATTAKIGDTIYRTNVGGGYTDTIEMPSFGRLYSSGNLYLYGGANLFLNASSSVDITSSDKVIISPNSELLVNGATRTTTLSATTLSATSTFTSLINSTNSTVRSGQTAAIINSDNSILSAATFSGIFNSKNSIINDDSSGAGISGQMTIIGAETATISGVVGKSSIIGGDNNTITNSKSAFIFGGSQNSISGNSENQDSIIIGGFQNNIRSKVRCVTINSTATNISGATTSGTTIISCSGITATESNSVYVPDLRVQARIFSGNTNIEDIFQSKILETAQQVLVAKTGGGVTSTTGFTYTNQSVNMYGSGIRKSIKSVAATYSAQTYDFTILVTAGGADVYLPVSNTSNQGQVLNVKNANTGGSILAYTIGADRIDDTLASISIADTNSLTFQADGAGSWWII